jgi:hypothetical protein
MARETLLSWERAAVLISVLGLLFQVGAWIWWGGRLSQRVDMLEASQSQELQMHTNFRDANARQDVDIAVIKQQYSDILAQLNRIAQHIEQRR